MNIQCEEHNIAPVLAMRPAQAAEALGISPRKLWEITNAGLIPHFRIGRSVRYRVESLRNWLAEQEKLQVKK